MEYNILGLTDKGETKFLSELFSGWIDECKSKQSPTFTKEQVDYLIPILKSENNNFIGIYKFPTVCKQFIH